VFRRRRRGQADRPGSDSGTAQDDPEFYGDLDEQGVAWSADGFVYTVIADAPPESVARVITALPHDRDVGFWDRVVRGVKRMGSWFDPFG